MDGSYASTYTTACTARIPSSILFFPRRIAMYRILKRIVFTYGKTRPDLADHCPEQFDWEFLQYVWAFPKKERPKFESSLTSLDQN
jgi:adenylate kinase family enzyme